MKFKFGIVGTGSISAVHAQAIQMIEGASLAGAADISPERAVQFTSRYGGYAYADYRAMLDDPSVDAVCICTPSSAHYENAIEALSSGKHVVLEKPMALDCETAEEILAAVRRSGKQLTVISQLRFAESIRYAKKLITEQAFGKISMCSLSMNYWREPAYYKTSPWRGKKRYDGGGALMNQGIHGIDLLQFLMGPINVDAASARTMTHDIEVEDTLCALVSYDCGAVGTVSASTCAYPGFNRRLEIHGDRGHIIMRESSIEQLMINGEEIPCTDTLAEIQKKAASDPTAVAPLLHARQISNLIDAAEGRGKLVSDAFDGMLAVKTIETIYRAAGIQEKTI